MNGLTTIAALPTAGGCKAELTADKAKANAPVYATGGFVMGVDLASKPDQCGVSLVHVGKVMNTFTVGDIASVEIVEQVRKAMRQRHAMRDLVDVRAYRAKWEGVITDDQSDAEVLALARINPT